MAKVVYWTLIESKLKVVGNLHTKDFYEIKVRFQ